MPQWKLPHTCTLSVPNGSDKNMTNAQMHEILMCERERDTHTHTHTHTQSLNAGTINGIQ